MSRRPPSLRNAEYALPQLSRQAKSMIPGTAGGRLASASPVTSAGALLQLDGSDPVGEVAAFARDRFSLASSTPTLTLSAVPLDNSLHVYLNGLAQDEGTDYTLDGADIIVLSAMGAVSGDVLDTRYAYLGVLETVPADITDAPDPSLLWRLDETSGTVAVDSSGNGYDGTYYGTPGFSAASLLTAGTGHSVTFSGDDRVELAHADWMDLPTMTIEAFIKTTATNAPVWDRDVYGSSGNRDRIWASRVSSTGKFEFYTFDGAGSVVATATSTTTVNDNVKHHVAATVDGSHLRVYVGGVLEATVAAPGLVYTSGSSAYLGLGVNRSGGAGSIATTFVGQIDEAAFYAGIVLTDAQIAARAAA